MCIYQRDKTKCKYILNTGNNKRLTEAWYISKPGGDPAGL